jgi:hypothetical protein
MSSGDLLSAAQREVVRRLIETSAKGLGSVVLSRESAFLLINALERLAPEPAPLSLEEELFLAEGLYEVDSFAKLSAGKRAQYERQAAVMRARGAK